MNTGAKAVAQLAQERDVRRGRAGPKDKARAGAAKCFEE